MINQRCACLQLIFAFAAGSLCAVNQLVCFDCCQSQDLPAFGLLASDQNVVINFSDLKVHHARRKRDSVAFAIRAIVLPVGPLTDAIFAKDCRVTARAEDWLLFFGHGDLLTDYAEDE
jgi:hypothetical protein